VTIHDDAPTGNRWNYVAAEIAAEMVPLGPCNNGIDDDGDGLVDLADPACSRGRPAVPTAGASTESAACQDGVQNDGEGGIDFDGGQSIHGACSGGTCPAGVSDLDSDGVADPDSGCVDRPWRDTEQNQACGLGAELIGLGPLLWALRRRAGTPRLSRPRSDVFAR
jgi:hypothetical protein